MQWKKAWEGSSSRGWRGGLGRQGADCCLLFSDCKLRNCFSDLGVRHVMAQTVKTLPTMQETQVRSLGWEDPLEKGMTTHSRILAQRIAWTKEPGGLQSMGSQRVRHD